MNPEIKQTSGLYSLWWTDCGIHMEVSHVYSHKDGRTQAEILVTHNNGTGSKYLNRTQMNLLSSITRKKFAKEMEERKEGIPWEEMIERMAFDVLALDRAGEPIIEISTSNEIEEPKHLIWPMVPERQPTIIYGPGSAGKSLFCLVLAMEALMPGSLPKLGLRGAKAAPVLYLDWETDETEITYRTQCIQAGMNLPPEIYFQYRRCALPLADDLEQVQRVILDKGIGLVICDSLGPACGGDLNQAEPAIRFYGALRQLGVTSLITAHEAKDEISAGKGPYGNVYFLNLARSVWRIKKAQQPGKDNYQVVLKHTKVNSGKLQMPLGYDIYFDKGIISVSRIDAAKIPDLADIITVRLRIVSALKTKMYSAVELAAIVGTSPGEVSKELTRMKEEGVVNNAVRGLWGLVQRGSD